MFDVHDGQILHPLLVPLCVDERGCVPLHLNHAPPGSLILFDRGYPAQWLFALLQQQGAHFVMRLPAGYNPDVNAFLQSGLAEQEIAFAARHWAPRQACAEAGVDPDAPVQLRLIRVPLATGETEILATSLRDAQRFPAAEFAGLYHLRWGVETDYRRLKQTLDLENFSGRSVRAVKQDFYAAQFLKNLAQLLLRSQQAAIDRRHRNHKHRWKANFTQGVSRLKNTLVKLVIRPCAELMAHLLAQFRQSLSVIRPGRSFPRQRRRPATSGCEGYKPTR